MKFRMKPVFIDAEQLTQERIEAYVFDKLPLPDGCRRADSHSHPATRTLYTARIFVRTLDGDVLAETGDWIIRSVKGTYLCKPDIFEATYEAVEATA